MSTGYVGRIHGCLRASWGTLSGYCEILRQNKAHSERLIRAERYGWTRVDKTLGVGNQKNSGQEAQHEELAVQGHLDQFVTAQE